MAGEHFVCKLREKDLRERLAALEFFTAILLAVSVNRAANLEALETFIKDLHNAATSR